MDDMNAVKVAFLLQGERGRMLASSWKVHPLPLYITPDTEHSRISVLGSGVHASFPTPSVVVAGKFIRLLNSL